MRNDHPAHRCNTGKFFSQKPIPFRKLIFLTIFFSITMIWNASVTASDLLVINGQHAIIYYEKPLKPLAGEVDLGISSIKGELEQIFGWSLEKIPEIRLVQHQADFLKMTRSPHVVAFARPEQNIIVMDTSRLNGQYSLLRSILKHEYCHLLLHHHIHRTNLPKWLDEGLCQWVSGGIHELSGGKKQNLLPGAALSGRLIPLHLLTQRFPDNPQKMMLAYEESRSFLDFLLIKLGKDKVLHLLGLLKAGTSMEMAVTEALEADLHELESKWVASLGTHPRIIAFISGNLYQFLFLFMALVTVVAFIRLSHRRKNYVDDDDDE
jgi:hypothetical protein